MKPLRSTALWWLRSSSLALAAVLGAVLAWALATSPAQAAPLSSADREAVAKAEDYLNAITTLKAHLLQVAPDGGTSEGTLYLKRPGHLRLEYDPPSQVLMRASSDYLYYTDKSDSMQRSYVDVADTPAAILISPHVALDSGKLAVTAVSHQAGVTRISVTDRAEPANGSITLVFTDSPYALRQWQILDPHGQSTTVSLYDPHTDLALDDSLFTFPDPKTHHRRFNGDD